jgi:hypothetical protein
VEAENREDLAREGFDAHPMIAAMNALGFDAGTLGNHEFNYGLPALRRALAGASFRWLRPTSARGRGCWRRPPRSWSGRCPARAGALARSAWASSAWRRRRSPCGPAHPGQRRVHPRHPGGRARGGAAPARGGGGPRGGALPLGPGPRGARAADGERGRAARRHAGPRRGGGWAQPRGVPRR